MANEIDSGGSAAELIAAEVVDPLVIRAAYANRVVLPLVYHFDLRGKNTLTSEHVKFPATASSALTDGTDLTNTDVDTTSNTVTAGSQGVMITITDLFLAGAAVDIGRFATHLGRAVGDKIEVDLAAEFADFTTSVGTTTSNMTNANFLSAIYENENKDILDRGALVSVLHPIQISDLRSNIAGLTGTVFGVPGFGDSPFGARQSFNLYGVEVFSSTNCASVNTNADRQGAMWPRGESIVYQLVWNPRTEFQRDASMRGWEIVATAAYGDECIDPAAGVKIVTDHE